MIQLDAFGEVVIVQEDDERFGRVINGLSYGRNMLPIIFENKMGRAVRLTEPKPPYTGNPGSTNLNLRIDGFKAGDEIGPGHMQRGMVIFQPTMRGRQIGTIRFFTEPSGDYVVKGVGGSGIINAKAEAPPTIKLDSDGIGRFLLRNRGDRPLLIKEATFDVEGFELLTHILTPVPPEFEGGDRGIELKIRYHRELQEKITARIELQFEETELGHVKMVSINISGGA